MNKSGKVGKYIINTSIRSIGIYYAILSAIMILSVIASRVPNQHVQMSGVEFSSMIFLFILGLNSFKENFYFTQANNVSRKTYYKGAIIAFTEISLGMSFIDVVFNRILNIFIKSPNMYDMTFGSFRGEGHSKLLASWTQSNSIDVLFKTFIYQFVIYMTLIALGLLINMIYYKCNKLMKTVVSLSPIFIIIILSILVSKFPEFFKKIGIGILKILGLTTGNVYMFVLTFACLFAIFIGLVYVVLRKAIIKQA